MDELTCQDHERWGARVNPESRVSSRDWPVWANPWQKEKWARSGLIVWDHASHTVTALSATEALRILEELRATPEWLESGLVIGEPCVKLFLEEPARKPEPALQSRITLDAGQARTLFDLLTQNEALLRRMSEAEEKDAARRLAEAYRIILNFGQRKREKEQESHDLDTQPCGEENAAEPTHVRRAVPGGKRGRRSSRAEPAEVERPAASDAPATSSREAGTCPSDARPCPSGPAQSAMEQLIDQIRAFNRERDWGQFHTPKNLAMALSVEVRDRRAIPVAHPG